MNRIAKLLGHPSLSSLRVMELWQEYEARESVASQTFFTGTSSSQLF